jgi:hypothetical protein
MIYVDPCCYVSDLPSVNPATNDRMILYYCLMTKWISLGNSTKFYWAGCHRQLYELSVHLFVCAIRGSLDDLLSKGCTCTLWISLESSCYSTMWCSWLGCLQMLLSCPCLMSSSGPACRLRARWPAGSRGRARASGRSCRWDELLRRRARPMCQPRHG